MNFIRETARPTRPGRFRLVTSSPLSSPRWIRRRSLSHRTPIRYESISSSSSLSLYVTDEASSDTFYQTALNASDMPKPNETFIVTRDPNETYTIDVSDDFNDGHFYEPIPFTKRTQNGPTYQFPPNLVPFEDEMTIVSRVTRRRNRLTRMSHRPQVTSQRRIRL